MCVLQFIPRRQPVRVRGTAGAAGSGRIESDQGTNEGGSVG